MGSITCAAAKCTIGFKLYGVRAASVPKAIGLENGDLVTTVNGRALDTMEAAMNMYSQLRGTDTMTLEYERKGAPAKIEITVG